MRWCSVIITARILFADLQEAACRKPPRHHTPICKFAITLEGPNIENETTAQVEGRSFDTFAVDRSCDASCNCRLIRNQVGAAVMNGSICNKPTQIASVTANKECGNICQAAQPSAASPSDWTQYFAAGVNILAGYPIYDVNSPFTQSVFGWTFKNGQKAMGFDLPDQLAPVQVTYLCNKNSAMTDVVWINSTEKYKASSSAVSAGLNADNFMKAYAEGEEHPDWLSDVQAGGMFSNSQESSTDNQYNLEGYSKRFTVTATAEMYRQARSIGAPIHFSQDFLDRLNRLGMTPSTSELFNFLSDFGMAVIDEATFGAKFEQSAYFTSTTSNEHIIDYRNEVSHDSVDFIIGSYSHDSSHTTKTINDTMSKVVGEWVRMESRGSVLETSCFDLSGHVNNLLPITYTLKPLYDLPCVQSHPAAAKIRAFVRELYDTAKQCGDQQCSKQGLCVPNGDAWRTKAWPGSTSQLFHSTRCGCFDGWFGPACTDDCASDMLTDADCIEKFGNDKSVCYNGKCFESCYGKSREKDCGGHGVPTVHPAGGGCYCKCDEGFAGATCNACDTNSTGRKKWCNFHGTPQQHPTGSGGCACNCDHGWKGADCSSTCVWEKTCVPFQSGCDNCCPGQWKCGCAELTGRTTQSCTSYGRPWTRGDTCNCHQVPNETLATSNILI